MAKSGNQHIATLTDYPVSLPVNDVPPGTGPTSLCLRAEDLQVSKAGPSDPTGPGIWRGHIDVASFQGATVRYRITLEEGPVVEAIAMPQAGDWLSTGDTATVRVAPNTAQVLKDDTASPVLTTPAAATAVAA